MQIRSEVAIAALEAGCDRVYFEPETGSKACRCRKMDIVPMGQGPVSGNFGQVRDLLVRSAREQPADILEMAINP